MKKTRRFVALLLAAVLALALFTACGAAGAEEPQSAIGKVYEDWFVEKINSKRPADKPVQKVDVKRSEMRAALAKISEDGKFTAKDGYYEEQNETEKESHYWFIISNPNPWDDGVSETKAVALTPENLTKYGQNACGRSENMTKYGPSYFVLEEQLYRTKEYDIATRVMDGKTYVAVYLCLEKKPS